MPRRSAGTYFYHQDALGSIVALSKFNSTTGHAEIVEGYSYDAFGRVGVNCSAGDDGNWLTCDNGTIRNTSNTSAYGNRFMYAGREYEGCIIGLYYYRARFYKPDIGRFLQPDPIGYDDGPNMYAYCTNNPLAFVDPYGLCKEGYGIEASLSGFGDAIAGRIGRFLTTSPKAHLKNFYSGLYGFGEMLNQSLYDIGADPGIVYRTLYDFGYHSNEIYLNEIANKTDYQLGGMIGNLTFDAEIAVVASKVASSLKSTQVANTGKVVGNKITGFTKHGIDKVIERGVSPRQILDAVKNPQKVVYDSVRRTTKYIGAENTVILNNSGKVVTAW